MYINSGESLKKEEFEKMYKIERMHWYFKSKRNLIFDLLRNYRNSTLLDIGCGVGLNLSYFSSLFKNAIGIDISKDALFFSKKYKNKNLVLADAKRLPFKDNSIDIITALDVIEHIENDNTVIKEIKRVLKGNLILTVPAFNFLWSKHDEYLYHKRRYNKKQLKELLIKNNFKIEKISYWNFSLFPIVLLYKFLNSKGSNIKKHNILLNMFLSFIISFDNFLFKYINLPFGTSIVVIAKKL